MIDDDRCGLIKTGDVNIQKPLAANFMDSYWVVNPTIFHKWNVRSIWRSSLRV